MQAIVEQVRAAIPDAKIIVFPRGSGAQLLKVALIDGISAIGLDTSVDPAWAARELPKTLAAQGNLDPLALLAGGAGLDEGIDRILDAFAGRPHVFNLGHGILPPTPIEHVERLLKRVRG
jgi:uroporphyrinogen decarboxylase